jgi:hypothetical protein
MAIFNKVKNVINGFVESKFISERTGRLISKKINCLLNNYEYDNIKNIMRENKKLTIETIPSNIKVDTITLREKVLSVDETGNLLFDVKK